MPTKAKPSTADAPVLALRINEAIKAMRVSRQTVYDEINAGRLRTFTIGRRRLVSVEAIHDWIKAHEGKTNPASKNLRANTKDAYHGQ